MTKKSTSGRFTQCTPRLNSRLNDKREARAGAASTVAHLTHQSIFGLLALYQPFISPLLQHLQQSTAELTQISANYRLIRTETHNQHAELGPGMPVSPLPS